MLRACRFSTLISLIGAASAPLSCRADIDPNSGIDLVRIGSPGNTPWMGGPIGGDQAIGRGGVNYEYSIGKFEVTTAQWCEFMNAAFDRPASDRVPFVVAPQMWGALAATPTTSGGRRWTVPVGHEMLPVGGINWRTAAIYCNWLENNKDVSRNAFMNGAYDVTTFGNTGTIFTDQLTHNANARYWIPSWDEQIKAFHFDPNKNGLGQAGYWLYSQTSDSPPIPGPPPSMGGHGQVNAGLTSVNPFLVPLGAYTTITSPWGLFDTGGATSEWTESPYGFVGLYADRIIDGSSWQDPVDDDAIARSFTDFPGVASSGYGFRIASSIPAPGSGMLILFAAVGMSHRRRRETRHASNAHRDLARSRRARHCKQSTNYRGKGWLWC